jgi:hypothetical protein
MGGTDACYYHEPIPSSLSPGTQGAGFRVDLFGSTLSSCFFRGHEQILDPCGLQFVTVSETCFLCVLLNVESH